jgi:2-iminobutanoate/2-iminopropanoate deaminase
MEKKCVLSPAAPPAVGPYSHAVVANGFVFVSGQGPVATDGSGVVRGTIQEESRLTLDNLRAVLEDSGSSLQHVVKVTAYLADMGNFAAFNDIYREYFSADFPARTCIQAGRLPLDFQVEVDAIAVLART